MHHPSSQDALLQRIQAAGSADDVARILGQALGNAKSVTSPSTSRGSTHASRSSSSSSHSQVVTAGDWAAAYAVVSTALHKLARHAHPTDADTLFSDTKSRWAPQSGNAGPMGPSQQHPTEQHKQQQLRQQTDPDVQSALVSLEALWSLVQAQAQAQSGPSAPSVLSAHRPPSEAATGAGSSWVQQPSHAGSDGGGGVDGGASSGPLPSTPAAAANTAGAPGADATNGAPPMAEAAGPAPAAASTKFTATGSTEASADVRGPGGWGIRDAGSTLLALARLGVPPTSALLQATVDTVASTAWCNAPRGLVSGEQVAAACEGAARLPHLGSNMGLWNSLGLGAQRATQEGRLTPMQLLAVVRAHAAAGKRCAPLLQEAGRQLAASPGQFTVEQAVELILVCAKTRSRSKELLAAAMNKVAAYPSLLTPPTALSLMSSMAKMTVQHRPLAMHCANCLAPAMASGSLTREQLVAAAWVAAVLGVRHAGMLDSLGDAYLGHTMQAHGGLVDVGQLQQLAWAYARLSHHHPALVQKLGRALQFQAARWAVWGWVMWGRRVWGFGGMGGVWCVVCGGGIWDWLGSVPVVPAACCRLLHCARRMLCAACSKLCAV